MQTNPFIKPIISKHNKSPLLGGKINIKIKSLSGLQNPLKQSFKNSFLNRQKMINPFKYESAQLELNKEIKDINDFKYDDIKIVNYNSYSTVKYPLSVGL